MPSTTVSKRSRTTTQPTTTTTEETTTTTTTVEQTTADNSIDISAEINQGKFFLYVFSTYFMSKLKYFCECILILSRM